MDEHLEVQLIKIQLRVTTPNDADFTIEFCPRPRTSQHDVPYDDVTIMPLPCEIITSHFEGRVSASRPVVGRSRQNQGIPLPELGGGNPTTDTLKSAYPDNT